MSAQGVFDRRLAARKRKDKLFQVVAVIALGIALGVLVTLLADVARRGAGAFDWSLFTNFPSRFPDQAGLKSALVGTFFVLGLTAAIAVPIGIGAAVFLEELAPNNKLKTFIQTNIANLAGVPSIVYGLLGLELFVRAMKLERSVMAGALTLALLVLPIIIISAQEGLRTVPRTLRDAAYALGATKLQAIWGVVLPRAMPAMLTGIILALSRAIGETAPLIMIGALTFIAFLPDSVLAPFTVLPIQIFNWISRPQAGFHDRAAAGILVLLMVLLFMNAVAIFLRARLQKHAQD